MIHLLWNRGARRRAVPASTPGYVNPFISIHVPLQLWPALVRTFGRTVEYWLDDDPATSQELTLIWVEGASDEQVSPGRYSHVKIRHSDLPRPPKKGDVVIKDSVEYDVVGVDAYAYDCSNATIQDRTEELVR